MDTPRVEPDNNQTVLLPRPMEARRHIRCQIKVQRRDQTHNHLRRRCSAQIYPVDLTELHVGYVVVNIDDRNPQQGFRIVSRAKSSQIAAIQAYHEIKVIVRGLRDTLPFRQMARMLGNGIRARQSGQSTWRIDCQAKPQERTDRIAIWRDVAYDQYVL